jgi:ABC-type bacteriocin/lantibiotic exporter with double-glycine peptidase domain
MTELIELVLAFLVAIVFTAIEVAVTLYATEKTTERIMKHVDENHRKLEQSIEELKQMETIKSIDIHLDENGQVGYR